MGDLDGVGGDVDGAVTSGGHLRRGAGGVGDAERQPVAAAGVRRRGHGAAEAHREDRDHTDLGQAGRAQHDARRHGRRRALRGVPTTLWADLVGDICYSRVTR